MKQVFYLSIILFLFNLNESPAQKAPKKITITGVVLDANLKPVQGAIILIDNKKTDIKTDTEGFYKIKVSTSAKRITVFTLTQGFCDDTIHGRTLINFAMKGNASATTTTSAYTGGEESINVGYGTMKKKDMTTSVGKIDATKSKYASYRNIYDLIRGEIPGVQVTGNSIMIQGPTSLTSSTEPLFVVDGVVVGSIIEISPQMVKSIEVLKGSAAAIYGSRGANGVILINMLGSPEREK